MYCVEIVLVCGSLGKMAAPIIGSGPFPSEFQVGSSLCTLEIALAILIQERYDKELFKFGHNTHLAEIATPNIRSSPFLSKFQVHSSLCMLGIA